MFKSRFAYQLYGETDRQTDRDRETQRETERESGEGGGRQRDSHRGREIGTQRQRGGEGKNNLLWPNE